jgi:hypothetical protein
LPPLGDGDGDEDVVDDPGAAETTSLSYKVASRSACSAPYRGRRWRHLAIRRRHASDAEAAAASSSCAPAPAAAPSADGSGGGGDDDDLNSSGTFSSSS